MLQCFLSSPLARILFNINDEPLLNTLFDDNLRIEPEFYAPIIPMVLVNGADGIGTGWSTKIPNYNVREIVANLKKLIEGDEPEPMVSYNSFQYCLDCDYVRPVRPFILLFFMNKAPVI